MNLIESLPAIGSFLLGPAGGIAGAGIEWLASKFGASDKTVEGIKQVLANAKPDDLLAAKKLDIEFQEFCLENSIHLQLAQIAVNTEEAKSESFFVSGGRPACIWIGALGLAYASFMEPLMRFIATVMFSYAGDFPAIDTTITMQVLFGLLGLGAMRSFDKSQVVKGNS
jgi:hypothetical protein